MAAVQIINQETEMVKVSDLVCHPKNPRKGDPKSLAESFKVNGFYGHVLVQRSTRHILVGNHRVLAARKARMPKVPVIWLDVDDEQAERIMVTDNRQSDKATYDDTTLAELLQSLALTSLGLEGLGWDSEGLDELLSSLNPGMEEPEGAPREAPASTDFVEDGSVPESQVRMIQLFFTVATIDKFLERVGALRDRWKLENVTDTVMRAIELCHNDSDF